MIRRLHSCAALIAGTIALSAIVALNVTTISFARSALNDAEREAQSLCSNQARGAIWFSDANSRATGAYNTGYYKMGVTVDNDQDNVTVYLHGSATTCRDSSNTGDRFYAIRIRSESSRLTISSPASLYRGQWDNTYNAYDWTSMGGSVQGRLRVNNIAEGAGGGSETIQISLYRCPSRNGTTVSGDPGIVCYASNVPVTVTRRPAQWSITPTSAVNPSSVAPGGTTRFTHRLRNTGGERSGTLRADVYERWQGSAPRAATRVGGDTSLRIGAGDTETFAQNVTIPPAAQPGDRVCQWIVVSPRSASNSSPRSSEEVCARVTDGYELSALVAADPDVSPVSEGSIVTLIAQTNREGRDSNHSTFNYTWRTWFDTGDRTYNVGEEQACVYVSRSSVTQSGSGIQEHQRCENIVVSSARSGGRATAVCGQLIVTATDGITVVTAGAPPTGVIRCISLGKYPHLEARNGDLYAGGQFAGGACTLVNKPIIASSLVSQGSVSYTSYATYGVTSLGLVDKFGSAGSSYNNALATTRSLIFSNNTGSGNNLGYFHNATGDNDSIPSATTTCNLNNPFTTFGSKATSAAGGSNIDISGLSANTRLTASGTINLSASSPIPAGKKIVIYANNNANIRITSNITYANQAYGSLNNIPQIIVLTDRSIVVDHTVTQLDGIYAAKKNFYTCDTVPRLNSCNTQLTVNGAVLAGEHTVPLRTYGAEGANPSEMAEIFNLAPSMFLNQLPGAGSSDIYIKTLSEIEVPPRF